MIHRHSSLDNDGDGLGMEHSAGCPRLGSLGKELHRFPVGSQSVPFLMTLSPAACGSPLLELQGPCESWPAAGPISR